MTQTRKIPTSADIYLEVDGTRVAVVQSYRVTAARKSRAIEAFGQEEPVATIRGNTTYEITLSRLYATDAALRDGLDFYSLSDFSLVIVKPDRSVIYTGCQWSNLQEQAEVGGSVLEQVQLTATRRVETPL